MRSSNSLSMYELASLKDFYDILKFCSIQDLACLTSVSKQINTRLREHVDNYESSPQIVALKNRTQTISAVSMVSPERVTKLQQNIESTQGEVKKNKWFMGATITCGAAATTITANLLNGSNQLTLNIALPSTTAILTFLLTYLEKRYLLTPTNSKLNLLKEEEKSLLLKQKYQSFNLFNPHRTRHTLIKSKIHKEDKLEYKPTEEDTIINIHSNYNLEKEAKENKCLLPKPGT